MDHSTESRERMRPAFVLSSGSACISRKSYVSLPSAERREPRNLLINISLKLYFKALCFSTTLWKNLWKSSAVKWETLSFEYLADFAPKKVITE